jgi:ribonuclease HII
MTNTQLICGIDEAGRGPLAGPVCAAAVILGEDFPRELLNDSKKLSAVRRFELQQKIQNSFAWGVGWVSHIEIDSINILQASLLAMKRAFEEMMKNTADRIPAGVKISVVVDGTHTPDLNTYDTISCKALIKADAQIYEVMAASILAKTARDAYMEEMAQLYPLYGYEKHKGYPTKLHREMIHKYGPSPIQRMSFNYL